jgi:hypothetical protein
MRVGKIKIDCASCAAVVRVDEDKVTARTRCPRCGSVLQAVEQSIEEIEEDEDEPPAPRPPAKQNPEIAAWQKVRIGLLVLLIVTGTGLVSMIVGQVILLFAARWILTSFVTRWSFWLGFSLCILGMLAVATLAAYVLLGFTPRRYAPRSLIGVVVGIDLLMYAFIVLGIILTKRMVGTMGQGGLEGAMSWMQVMLRMLLLMIPLQFLAGLQLILLPLFLRQVGHAVEDPQAEHHCDTIIKWTCISLSLQIGGPLLGFVPVIGMLSAVLALFGAILSVATRGIYMHLHLCLRESIAKHMRRLRRQGKKRKEGKEI